MKRAVIVHCWGGTPDYAWYPWAKAELEKLEYKVLVPAMPDTENPNMITWVPELANTIGTVDEELVLIGHSIGCATIMRYLESLDGTVRVRKVVFAAGFGQSLGLPEIDNFFSTPINFTKIATMSIDGYVAVQSDNDPYVPMAAAEQLCEELGARLVIKQGANHMSGPVDDEASCLELPEIIDALSAVDAK